MNYAEEAEKRLRDAWADVVLEPVELSGGKRTNIMPSEWLSDWWVGYGKGESCQFEGPWIALAILAEKILSHPNTKIVAPNLFTEQSRLTEDQQQWYSGTSPNAIKEPKPSGDIAVSEVTEPGTEAERLLG